MSINLYDIYKKVYKRKQDSNNKSSWTQFLAGSMAFAAKGILEKNTLKSVKNFEVIEKSYLSCFDVKATHPIANDFYLAIRSKDFYVRGTQLNTHRNGINVTDGLVYFLKSSDKPRQIKIGYTQQDIYLRMNQIKRKQQLCDIGMHFYISTNKTTELEDAIHKSLKTVRVSGRVEKNESTEWFYSDRASVVDALFAMAQLCDASVKVEWASAYYKKLLATEFPCN
jgi:hypothetical protein